jgi:putative peptidoglycan lipid II flippase
VRPTRSSWQPASLQPPGGLEYDCVNRFHDFGRSTLEVQVRQTLTIAVLASTQLLFSFAFQLVVLRVIGAGLETDAFVAAQTMPLLLVAVIATSMQSLWQPFFAVAAPDVARWTHLQRVAQSQIVVVVGLLGLVIGTTATLWVPVLYPGLPNAVIDQVISMVRVLLLGSLLAAHATVLTVALRTSGRFVVGEAVSATVAGGSVVAAYILVPVAGVEGAAWILVTRNALAAFALFLFAGRPFPALTMEWYRHESIRQLRSVAGASSVYKLAPLVDRFWASYAPAGGLTLLNLAQTGLGALAQVIDRALCMPVAPSLATLCAERRYREVEHVVLRTMLRVLFIACLVLAVLLLIQPYWAQLGAGVLDMSVRSADQLWWLCVLLIGYLFVAAAGTTPVSAFYAMGDTRTPMKVGLAGFALGVVLKSAAFMNWGLMGLVSATSAYYLLNMVVMTYLLRRALHERAAS